MRKSGGLRLGRKMGRVFKWFINRRAQTRAACPRLGSSRCTGGALSKLYNWGRSLRLGAKGLCFAKRKPGYIRVGQEPVAESKNSVSIPKGHLAVYVGEDDDETCRVLVPVIYFNHPLFADLLREAEKVHGFDHPGGIQIPCQKSEFESVKMRIAAAGSGGVNSRGGRSWRQLLLSSRHEKLDN
ncbi:auxin-responsive protein SAUR36-like [Coffea arabica]|uniref:Auxin-responsive protein SAUR36-like n=1 Tax=Coffea arabica TaxID=13443 RepID=A0ABM4VCK2_COFAR|nr:auxin-responsive protein SAUR36-like [Coffea arabica]